MEIIACVFLVAAYAAYVDYSVRKLESKIKKAAPLIAAAFMAQHNEVIGASEEMAEDVQEHRNEFCKAMAYLDERMSDIESRLDKKGK